MAQHRLMRRVEEVADRLQRLYRIDARSRNWTRLSAVALVLLLAQFLLGKPVLSPLGTIVAGCLLLGLGAVLSLRVRADVADAVKWIEDWFPDLDSRLTTALSQRPDYESSVGGFSFLQHEVISEALLHAQRNDWNEAVPQEAMAAAKITQGEVLTYFVAMFVTVLMAGPRTDVSADIDLPKFDASVLTIDDLRPRIEPGDVQLERGSPLLVLAWFDHNLPQEVTLVTNDADGARQEIPLSRSLDDPLFGGRVASVPRDLTYYVQFDDRNSDEFRVTVFDYPQLQQADATIEYPEYTGMAVKTIEDVRHVSVLEGSKLTLSCRLNKPVTSARLFDVDGTELVLTADEHQPQRVAVTWTPDVRRTLTLELIDDAGRRNKQPPNFVVDVIPNQPPDLQVAFPARDMRVSPLQELPLEAEVRDDFGVKEFGLVYQLPKGDEQTLKLGGEAEADTRVELAHELSFEQINAQPNELVAYYFYADDVGPTGEMRRTLSNMYFAEVRHFDEIYRQMTSTGEAGQPGASGTPSQKLLELQRDVVTANWNLLRREHGEPSAELPEDARTIADSQGEALGIADQMQATLDDALSKQHLAEAIEHMQAGEEHLRTAAETPAIAPLSKARASTLGAYGALLKLQAREMLVMQSQGAQSAAAGGAQQKLNEQLQQLELKNDRNRYESEPQDKPQADREALQVLNRLKELARRQGDLNKKIQELQNELRTAQTEEQRKEIERQLKRLQEEQQQLLRDLDEAKERMKRPENRSRMADARKQIEETREHLRQTKDALQAGQVSKALAEGTRAERELDEMKDQFRDQASGQFAESMRDLREQARELADQEQEVSEQLAEQNPGGRTNQSDGGRPRLRDEKPSQDELSEALAEQKEKLTDVMRQAEEIVREAETSEPLLSKKLYDAVRSTRVDQPEESLEMTSRFLRLGLDREASQAEQQARRGIDKLREGVEEAAQSVLGSEAESLERAREEIDKLAKAVAAELAQADPEFAERMTAEDAKRVDQDSEDRRNGKPGESEDSPTDQPGQQSGDKPGERPGEKTERPSAQPGDKPGEGRSGQPPSEGQSGEGQSNQRESGQQPSDRSKSGEGQPGEGQPGEGGGNQPGDRQRNSQPGSRLANLLQQGAEQGGGATGPHLGPQRPLTSSEFVEWSDRMRDVEEMLEAPELRAQVARIRDQAREMRIEVKRHSQEPDWNLVRLSVYGPMLELQDRLAEELARLEPDVDQIVPLDRDPVPDRYAELVRQYYERLGSGR